MRLSMVLIVVVVGGTILLGLIDTMLGWVDVFGLLTWILVGQGGLVELVLHLIVIGIYIILIGYAILEGVTGDGTFLEYFNLTGLINITVQWVLKVMALFMQIFDLIFGIWARPINFVLDLLMLELLIFKVSLEMFLLPLFILGFIGLTVLFFYKKEFHVPGRGTTSISLIIRGIAGGIPIIGDVLGVKFDNAIVQTIIDYTINPAIDGSKTSPMTRYTFPTLYNMTMDDLEELQNSYAEFRTYFRT